MTRITISTDLKSVKGRLSDSGSLIVDIGPAEVTDRTNGTKQRFKDIGYLEIINFSKRVSSISSYDIQDFSYDCWFEGKPRNAIPPQYTLGDIKKVYKEYVDEIARFTTVTGNLTINMDTDRMHSMNRLVLSKSDVQMRLFIDLEMKDEEPMYGIIQMPIKTCVFYVSGRFQRDLEDHLHKKSKRKEKERPFPKKVKTNAKQVKPDKKTIKKKSAKK